MHRPRSRGKGGQRRHAVDEGECRRQCGDLRQRYGVGLRRNLPTGDRFVRRRPRHERRGDFTRRNRFGERLVGLWQTRRPEVASVSRAKGALSLRPRQTSVRNRSTSSPTRWRMRPSPRLSQPRRHTAEWFSTDPASERCRPICSTLARFRFLQTPPPTASLRRPRMRSPELPWVSSRAKSARASPSCTTAARST